jgi:hypothetical protein
VPPLSHLTSCTLTKSNLYFYISFATLMSKPALYRLLTFHVPSLMAIFLSLGHLSKEFVQVCGPLWHFVTSLFFTVTSCEPQVQPPSYRTMLGWLSMTAYSIYSLPTLHIWRPPTPSLTWGHAMLWWQGTHLTWSFQNHLIILQTLSITAIYLFFFPLLFDFIPSLLRLPFLGIPALVRTQATSLLAV